MQLNITNFMPLADYALGWQDLFGSTINVDQFFLHQTLNLVIAYALENTKVSVYHVECIDSIYKKRHQIYLTFSVKSDSFDSWQIFARARTHWVNFCLFCKECLSSVPFYNCVRRFSSYQNFVKPYQTSKAPSSCLGGGQIFVRDWQIQNLEDTRIVEILAEPKKSFRPSAYGTRGSTALLKVCTAWQNFDMKIDTVLTCRMDLMTNIFAKETKIGQVRTGPKLISSIKACAFFFNFE